MDGIAHVQARIAAIESRFVVRAAPAAISTVGGSDPSTATSSTSFEAMLGGELQALSTGARNADGVPVELAQYGNGRIPADALVPIGVGSHRLWAPAAQSFRALLDAAAADGVHIGVTDSYRDYDTQVRLAEEKGLYSQGGLAATPGTSEHGWGLALDLDLDAEAQAWMRANGARFGFVENVPREPWHWEFQQS